MVHINDALVYVERSLPAMGFYGETLSYLSGHKQLFHSFLVQEPNYSFICKWKDAIKLHLWERIRHKGLHSKNESLILEMVAAEAIAGYTFWLTHPYEVNEADINRLLVYTLGMLE